MPCYWYLHLFQTAKYYIVGVLLVTYPIPSSIPTYFNVIYPHVLFLKSEFMSHINIHVALSEKLPPQISINFNKFHGCYL